MKILGIESSGNLASAAVWEDGKILSEKLGPFKVTHSETLMPLISQALGESKLDVKGLDLIAVSGGPGSFTGLRIGSATAKGLGFAVNKMLVHVPTLDAMAMNLAGTDGLIVPLMDARRGQVYAGIYEFKDGELVVLESAMAISLEDILLKTYNEYPGKKVTFLGDAVYIDPNAGAEANKVGYTSREVVKNFGKLDYSFAEGANALQRASSVAKLGAILASQGKTVSPEFESPEYLRPSQAERVKAEQGL